ncbi:hypothetical protein VB776_01660 [Arcicella sp. DC2W]|uniref:Uncharacterized protein n=1 Tax=Arcicella gelida TaxID=2984195 RepID=A0ABU5RZH0_9BACT|nr:hypothetical protein [Arcicella sp. DC2W]MEA5401603.1 hypothetical protein [Arcicella sp. DC2W]
MDTKIMTNTSELNESDKTYRTLESAILKIQRFTNKLAKKSNPSHELQAYWELGDLSLMNWISDTHCYISRKGQRLQFLAKPSKLEIISFHLEEGDKLLICGDSLRKKISDNEIDEILQNSSGPKDSCLNLLKIANIDTPYNVYNVHNAVVLEVIDQQKIITPIISDENNPFITKSNDKYLFIPIVLLGIGLLVYSYGRKNTFDISGFFNHQTNQTAVASDSTSIIKKDSLTPFQSNQDTDNSFENNPTEEASESSNSFDEPNSKPITSKVESSNAEFSSSEPTKVSPKTEKKTNTFNVQKEEQNYNALIEQKDKWISIRRDLQDKYNNGDSSVSDQLENSKKVIQRIEQKLQESSRKMNKN